MPSSRLKRFLHASSSPLGIGVSPVKPREPVARISLPAVQQLDLPAGLSLEAPVING